MKKKIDKLKHLKMQKEGQATPEEVIKAVYDHIDNVEEVVVVTMTPEGLVQTGYSVSTGLNGLGLVSIAQDDIMDDLKGGG